MLAEIRIEALGAISAATAEFDGGLTVLTGETGAGTAEQMQAGDHHGLAGTGLAGEHGESAVELGGRGADRAERLDTDFR